MNDVYIELIEEEDRALEKPYPSQNDGIRLMQELGLRRYLDPPLGASAMPNMHVPSRWPGGKPKGCICPEVGVPALVREDCPVHGLAVSLSPEEEK